MQPFQTNFAHKGVVQKDAGLPCQKSVGGVVGDLGQHKGMRDALRDAGIADLRLNVHQAHGHLQLE